MCLQEIGNASSDHTFEEFADYRQKGNTAIILPVQFVICFVDEAHDARLPLGRREPAFQNRIEQDFQSDDNKASTRAPGR